MNNQYRGNSELYYSFVFDWGKYETLTWENCYKTLRKYNVQRKLIKFLNGLV